MKRYALLLGVLAALPLAPARAAAPASHPADQSLPVNFNILPGSQHQGQPVKRAFIYTLAPGKSLADTVMIVNPSKTASLTVRLSVSDAVTRSQGGGVAFNDAGNQRGIGRWIHLAATTVTVPPYHLVYVPMTLRLPSSIEPGQYEGAINAVDTQYDNVTTGKIRVHVYLNRRCMVMLRVPGHASAGLKVTKVRVATQSMRTILSFAVQNMGTVIAYPTATTITFTGHKGRYIVRSITGTIMGGDTTALALAIARDVPPGTYQVRIGITYLAQPSPTAASQTLQTMWNGRLVVPAGMGS